MTTTKQWEHLEWLLSVSSASSASSALSFSYTYNNANQRTRRRETDGDNTFTAVAHDSYGRTSSDTINTYSPLTNSSLYDLNGNLLSDGHRAFDYDDENELIRITVTNAWKSEFAYDGRLRRRIRKEFTWLPAISDWRLTNEVHYVYDGNLVVRERWLNPQISTNTPQQLVTYTRGVDFSGTLDGAGGTGGLLSRSDSALGTAFYHGDGNGNITCLVNAMQAIAAKYLYDPYGNILSASGPLAEANLYRFSSKEMHTVSLLIYYTYRYYAPTLQRWMNSDPIREHGGLNLFRFCLNSSVNVLDSLGLASPGPGSGEFPYVIHLPDGSVIIYERPIQSGGGDAPGNGPVVFPTGLPPGWCNNKKPGDPNQGPVLLGPPLPPVHPPYVWPPASAPPSLPPMLPPIYICSTCVINVPPRTLRL